MKKIFCCPALELFHCLPPIFCCLPLWETVRLHGKKEKSYNMQQIPLIFIICRQKFLQNIWCLCRDLLWPADRRSWCQCIGKREKESIAYNPSKWWHRVSTTVLMVYRQCFLFLAFRYTGTSFFGLQTTTGPYKGTKSFVEIYFNVFVNSPSQ